MEFKSKTYTVEVTINDVKYTLKQPLMGDRLALETSEKGINSRATDWMVSLGLPLEVIQGLDEETFYEIVSYVNNPKKK